MRIVNALLCVLLVACGVASDDVQQGLANGNCESNPETGTCECWGSPIVFDLAGDGIHLTSGAGGVMFPLRGRMELWAWTARDSDDAWLVRDANGDGRIVGSEMFGDGTLQGVGTPNGFAALATLDVNHDGAITPADAPYDRLRLWRDANHDGVSQPAELVGLARYGITSISTSSVATRTVDAYGNEFRLRGSAVAAAPVSSTIFDVWLVRGNAAPVGGAAGTNTTLWRCDAWTWFEIAETPGHSYVRSLMQAETSTAYPGEGGANECWSLSETVHARPTGRNVAGDPVNETWDYVSQSSISSSVITALDQALQFTQQRASVRGSSCMAARHPPFGYPYDGIFITPDVDYLYRCEALISLPPPPPPGSCSL